MSEEIKEINTTKIEYKGIVWIPLKTVAIEVYKDNKNARIMGIVGFVGMILSGAVGVMNSSLKPMLVTIVTGLVCASIALFLWKVQTKLRYLEHKYKLNPKAIKNE